MKMLIIFLLYIIPLFAYSKSFSLLEIQRMTNDARKSLDGAVIDVYREYTFVGNRDGSSEETRHIIMLINEQEGIHQTDFKIYYNSSYEKPKLISGRVIKPDGSITKMGKKSARSEGCLEAINMELYSDIMVYILTLPGLGKGAIVEVVYEIARSHYPIKGEFWRELYIQKDNALWCWKYIIKVPKSKNIEFAALNFDGECEEKIHNKMQEFIYSGGPHNAIIPEILMPPPAFQIPRIAFSTLESYAEFGNWYWSQIEQKIKSNKNMMMMVAALTYKTEDKVKQMNDICYFVSSMIRYIALEFKETTYIPTSAAEVFECKYGDCKDKATLLISLLKIIDVEAYFVLISGIDRGQEIRDVPVFDQFSHAIVYIPEYDIWVDPTFPYAKINELPFQYQNRNAFVISDSVCQWFSTPIAEPHQNKTCNDIKIDIDDEGNAEIVIRETFTGLMATLIRTGYHALPENYRETMFKSAVAAQFPNVTDVSVTFFGIDSITQELSCSTYVYSENFAKKSGDLLIFDMPFDNNVFFDPTISLDERESPIYLPLRSETHVDAVICFAPKYRCVEKIEPLQLQTSFMESEITMDYNRGEIKISMYAKILDNYIKKDQFGELQELLKKSSKFRNDPIILKLR